MFNFFRKESLFTENEMNRILDSVKDNEQGTSGEIRIFMEPHCEYVNPVIRAQEIFVNLQMHATANRNGVMIYIAFKDKDFALIADKALFEITHQSFWNIQSAKLAKGFHENKYSESLIQCIDAVGAQLKMHFPFHGENPNELPDEIVFGK